MEGILNSKGVYLGDVDKAVDGQGWFATLVDEDRDYEFIAQDFHYYKREHKAYLKRQLIS